MSTATPQELLLQAVQLLQNQSTSSGSTIASESTRQQSILEERRRLFQPYSVQNRRRQTVSRMESDTRCTPLKKKGGCTWTHDFYCLVLSSANTFPSPQESVALCRLGLGTKHLTFPDDANASAVAERLYEEYPPLKCCGGFELMTAKAGKGRELFHAATGPLPVNEMRNLTSGKIYIRPLQRDIDIDELGLSMLQGGPMPTFFKESVLQRLFENNDLSAAEEQFLKGFDVVGLKRFIQHKPILLHLLRKSCEQPITVRKLKAILKPEFYQVSDSTRRQKENETYRLFLKYLHEVAGGRRCNGIITLGRILQFTTGRETEPLLGFSIAPSVCFNDDLVLASANTCICRLSLPHITEMEKDKAFERLDIAFANDFFGFA